MKSISILGSTGSIGQNTLDIVSRHHDQLRVIALAAGRNIDLFKQQIERYRPALAAVMAEEDAIRLKKSLPSDSKTDILWGADGFSEVACAAASEMVVSAMVGFAGLIPTLSAIKAGKQIALANKETLVAAGQLVVEASLKKNVPILPVDSEHSAVFQCLHGENHQEVRRIILTASGGPFFKLTKEELENVTPDDALKHPNWNMGKKITIDSASMMNKGLEVIEAKWLFNMDMDRIDVLIHPKSVIHSMVEFVDGAVLAQLGVPDMRIPIAYALSFPHRLPLQSPSLNFLETTPLEFFKPDQDRFPCLKLARDAGASGGTMPAVLNAANEVAVAAFLGGKIGFAQLPVIVEETMMRHSVLASPTLEDIIEADGWSRQEAFQIIKEINH